MNKLKITSHAFDSDGWIPNCNSGFGEDFSPETHIDGMDEEVREITSADFENLDGFLNL